MKKFLILYLGAMLGKELGKKINFESLSGVGVQVPFFTGVEAMFNMENIGMGVGLYIASRFV